MKKRSFFVDLPIRLKLLISHGMISILALILAACGLIGIWRVTDKVEILYSGPLACEEAIGDLMYATADLQRDIVRIISLEDNSTYAEFEEEMTVHVAAMGESTGALYQALTTMGATSSMAKVEEIGALIASSGDIRTEIMECIQTDRFNQADILYEDQYQPIFEQINILLEELNEGIDDMAQQYYDYSMWLSRLLTTIGFCLVAFTLVSVALITNQITKLIATPVLQLTAASERMQQGDLSAADSVTYESKDELGHLAESMRVTMRTLEGYVTEISDTLHTVATGDLTKNTADITDFLGQFASIKESIVFILKQLNTTLTDIHQSAEQVNSSSTQIAAGAQTLAQGAAEQAASVEELLATVTDISRQVSTTAEHANNAMQRVDETGTNIQTCSNQMSEMMSAMADLSQKSDQISKIVKTIEDIAFQTNILALNAAVEAARAGSAGKGFAVVADEVRNLASKSAEASKNTSDLINSTVDSVKNGTRILTETAQTLGAVVENAQAASGLVSEIAQAAKAEAQALDQVTTGLDQISSVVQTTSSTSEESASASVELAEQAENLKRLLEQFKLYV